MYLFVFLPKKVRKSQLKNMITQDKPLLTTGFYPFEEFYQGFEPPRIMPPWLQRMDWTRAVDI